MKKLILSLLLGSFLTPNVKAAVEYDIVKSIDLTATNYITAALLNQLVDTAKIGTTNKGIIIKRSGGGGSYWPDVTSNPRYTNFLWLDTVTSPATLKQYVCCGDVYSNWVSTVVTPESVTTTEILNYTITDNDLATNSVSDFAIKASAVSGNKIADNGILPGKLASAAVILGNYAFGSIVGGNITNNTITETNLADASVTRPKILSSAIGSQQISNNVILNQHLSNGVVYGTNIASATITSNNIAANTINTNQLATNVFINLPFAWVVFEGGTVKKGYNVSSVTAAGTGQYYVNFVTPAPDTNYAVLISTRRSSVSSQIGYFSNTLNSVVVATEDSGGTAATSQSYSVAIFAY